MERWDFREIQLSSSGSVDTCECTRMKFTWDPPRIYDIPTRALPGRFFPALRVHKNTLARMFKGRFAHGSALPWKLSQYRRFPRTTIVLKSTFHGMGLYALEGFKHRQWVWSVMLFPCEWTAITHLISARWTLHTLGNIERFVKGELAKLRGVSWKTWTCKFNFVDLLWMYLVPFF